MFPKVNLLTAIATASFFVATGCSSAPEDMGKVDPNIRDFSGSGPIMNYMMDYPFPAFESAAMLEIAETTRSVAEGLQAGLPGFGPEAETVRLIINIEQQDRLGQPANDRFGTVSFAVKDLKDVNLDAKPGLMILDLATEVKDGSGVSFGLATGYCSGESMFDSSPEFCRMVLAAAE